MGCSCCTRGEAHVSLVLEDDMYMIGRLLELYVQVRRSRKRSGGMKMTLYGTSLFAMPSMKPVSTTTCTRVA